MGKKIIIKGADFSDVAIATWQTVSESQSSMTDSSYYSGSSGNIVHYQGITGVEKITLPDELEELKVISAGNDIEPAKIVCFDSNDVFLGSVGSGDYGTVNPLGTTIFELPEGTKSISYVYVSSVGSFNIGLSLTWQGR